MSNVGKDPEKRVAGTPQDGDPANESWKKIAGDQGGSDERRLRKNNCKKKPKQKTNTSGTTQRESTRNKTPGNVFARKKMDNRAFSKKKAPLNSELLARTSDGILFTSLSWGLLGPIARWRSWDQILGECCSQAMCRSYQAGRAREGEPRTNLHSPRTRPQIRGQARPKLLTNALQAGPGILIRCESAPAQKRADAPPCSTI